MVGEALDEAGEHRLTLLWPTVALYISLRQDSGLTPWLAASSHRAAVVAGPENYVGKQ